MRQHKHHIWRSGLKTYCGRRVAAGFIITRADFMFDPDDRPNVCYHCQHLATHYPQEGTHA